MKSENQPYKQLFNMKENLELAIKSAIEAGKAIMGVYATEFSVDFKSDQTPLTTADTRADEIITKALNKTGLPIISEEGRQTPYHQRENWDSYWLVDPLDGTKEFVNRNGEFSVNIALISNKKAVAGIIYAPVTDILYFSNDQGAWKLLHAEGIVKANSKIENLRRESSKLPLDRQDNDFTIVASRSHLNPETTQFINEIKKKHDNIRIVSRGSSLKLCMIAEGLADVYPRFGITSEWDIAAGHAVVSAAGGRVVAIANESEELTYNNEQMENPPFIAYPPNRQ
jgi:3'(2'), 5'-bisphosphate nucleotidase